MFTEQEIAPLASIEDWEDDVLIRYPEPHQPSKTKEEYCNYDSPQRDTVKEFYRLNHTELKPYYEDLIAKYLPETLKF